MNYYNILNAYGIRKIDIKSFHLLSEENECLLFVDLLPNQKFCPYCNESFTKIKEYKTKTIKVLPIAGKNTFIEYRLPRYYCKHCKKTYTHSLIDTEKSLSKDLINNIMIDFSNMLSFSHIASKYNITTTQAISIFDKYCPNLRVPISEAICIDEFSNTRKSMDKYACMLVDFKTHKIIDIIKNRTLPYLREYFHKQPLSLRDNVKYIITDMYDGYITIAKEFFHNATIAIDPFHYIRYFTDAVQTIRRNLIKSRPNLIDASWMGKHWRLLTTNPDNIPNEKMILPSGMTISYRDRIIKFVKQDDDLNYAYWLLQNFYTTYKKLNYESATTFIEMIINNMLSSSSYELQQCGLTWLNYKEYIINSFIKYNGVRLSNGPIEGINSRIKTLKKLYCGYRSKTRFYNRVILIINKKDEQSF